jgi:hypothetical protein
MLSVADSVSDIEGIPLPWNLTVSSSIVSMSLASHNASDRMFIIILETCIKDVVKIWQLNNWKSVPPRTLWQRMDYQFIVRRCTDNCLIAHLHHYHVRKNFVVSKHHHIGKQACYIYISRSFRQEHLRVLVVFDTNRTWWQNRRTNHGRVTIAWEIIRFMLIKTFFVAYYSRRVEVFPIRHQFVKREAHRDPFCPLSHYSWTSFKWTNLQTLQTESFMGWGKSWSIHSTRITTHQKLYVFDGAIMEQLGKNSKPRTTVTISCIWWPPEPHILFWPFVPLTRILVLIITTIISPSNTLGWPTKARCRWYVQVKKATRQRSMISA